MPVDLLLCNLKKKSVLVYFSWLVNIFVREKERKNKEVVLAVITEIRNILDKVKV